ncbi:MAG: hypothetical protein U0610_07400 [bacterium]
MRLDRDLRELLLGGAELGHPPTTEQRQNAGPGMPIMRWRTNSGSVFLVAGGLDEAFGIFSPPTISSTAVGAARDQRVQPMLKALAPAAQPAERLQTGMVEPMSSTTSLPLSPALAAGVVRELAAATACTRARRHRRRERLDGETAKLADGSVVELALRDGGQPIAATSRIGL